MTPLLPCPRVWLHFSILVWPPPPPPSIPLHNWVFSLKITKFLTHKTPQFWFHLVCRPPPPPPSMASSESPHFFLLGPHLCHFLQLQPTQNHQIGLKFVSLGCSLRPKMVRSCPPYYHLKARGVVTWSKDHLSSSFSASLLNHSHTPPLSRGVITIGIDH